MRYDDEVRRGLIDDIEKQAHKKEIDVAKLVWSYRKNLSDKPILNLIQDINERIGIYSNILEEIKRLDHRVKNYESEATAIKLKYEYGLKLIVQGNLPNPTAESIVKYVLDKLSAFGRALVEIMARYATDLRKEIHIEAGIGIHFDVELGWSPSFTIGIEGPGAKIHSTE